MSMVPVTNSVNYYSSTTSYIHGFFSLYLIRRVTKAFNQQVKNNIEKFDEDFRFQISREELEDLVRSKKLTSRENNFFRF